MPRRSASTVRSGWRLSNWLQLARVEARALDVPRSDAEEPFALLGLELTHHLSRRAHDQHAIGNFLALGDQGVGAGRNGLADLGAFRHPALDAVGGAVADVPAMQHSLVAEA